MSPRSLYSSRNSSTVAATAEALASFWLDHNVVSCADAADSKGIPLENELKTLILETSVGLCAVHLRGDHQLALRAVKRFLGIKQAHLLSREQLIRIGLTPGTICPFSSPVRAMRQLLSHQLLGLNFISTNNGQANGYFVFEPTLLLKAPTIQKGDFEVSFSPEPSPHEIKP